MAQLAADIVDKCKYIHPSRVEEIEQLLIKLRKHAANTQLQIDTSSAPIKENDKNLDLRKSNKNRRDEENLNNYNNNNNNNNNDYNNNNNYNNDNHDNNNINHVFFVLLRSHKGYG